MIHDASIISVIIFFVFVLLTLGISYYFASKTKSAKGYFAAHGEIHWFVNGVAFAGDYLSAASFLGICGMIAFYGYDGFLYSIGYLAGWIVALLVIAEPLKRLGKFTFADALDSTFQSRGIKLAVAISTLAVSIFYLIPQMVGAGLLIKPLLGFPHYAGVLLVGGVVIFIVTTAGMVSTTYVQFLKGSLLIIFSLILTILILNRGLTTEPKNEKPVFPFKIESKESLLAKGWTEVAPEGVWKGKPYVRFKDKEGVVTIWRVEKEGQLYPTQALVVQGKKKIVNGKPQGRGEGEGDFQPVGQIRKLPDGQKETGPLGPVDFLRTVQKSEMILWRKQVIKKEGGPTTTIYYPQLVSGTKVMSPGNHPNFKKLREGSTLDKLNFLSLMLALFCGTASLPHILIRYYTVKDQASARKSTIVGIGSIGFFYILTLFMGLGAMASGAMDVTANGMAAPLLARTFGEFMFAIISAIAFTTVLGTVSGLIVAASGAVAHDVMSGFLRLKLSEKSLVRAGKITAIVVGLIAIVLGILFQDLNPSYLVGWAFSVAASANLPALVMLLFWKGTTKQGIIAAVVVGMISSLTWILLSADTFEKVYGLTRADAVVPFSQPGIVTIPLGFLTLIVVSLLTRKQEPESEADSKGLV